MRLGGDGQQRDPARGDHVGDLVQQHRPAAPGAGLDAEASEGAGVEDQPCERQGERRGLGQEADREQEHGGRVPASPPPAAPRPASDGVDVREGRGHGEETGQDVAAGADPDHGLGAEGVDREDERRHHGRRPGARGARGLARAGLLEESRREPVDEDRRGRVTQEAGQVVAERLDAPERVVEGPAEPGDGLVEPVVGGRPHPPQLGGPDAVELRVVADLLEIVVRQELAPEAAGEDRERRDRDQRGGGERAPGGSRRGHLR